MILRAFLFSLKAACRFLIYTCYFADVDSLSAENMIADLLSSPNLIQKLCIRSVIAIYHWAQLVDFSTQNLILSSKTQFQCRLQVSDFNMLLYNMLYIADVDSLSGENMIVDLLSSPISIQKLCFRSAIALYHWAQLVHFRTQNLILGSKTSP